MGIVNGIVRQKSINLVLSKNTPLIILDINNILGFNNSTYSLENLDEINNLTVEFSILSDIYFYERYIKSYEKILLSQEFMSLHLKINGLKFDPNYLYSMELNGNGPLITISADDFSLSCFGVIGTFFSKPYSVNFIVNIFISNDNSSLSLYDLQANIIGTDVDSFLLLRTNPLLTGNIKLVVDSSYKLYLDTFKVSSTSILNSKKYRHQYISAEGNYPRDVKKIFSTLPLGDLYSVFDDSYEVHKNFYDLNIQYRNIYEYGAETNSDSLYDEGMKILAPLHIGKTLPEFFVIFKTDIMFNQETYSNHSIDDVSKLKEMAFNSEVVKIFDLRNHTSIGLYINNYKQMIEDFLHGSCYLLFIEQDNEKNSLNYRQGRNSWKGISVDRGVLTTKSETSYFSAKILDNPVSRQEKYNMFLLNGFSRNNLLYPNILNLEFMFDDETEEYSMHNYFGLYLKENDFLEFNFVNYDLNDVNAPLVYHNNNGNTVDEDKLIDIIEDLKFKDRLFFLTTYDKAQKVTCKDDFVSFMKKNVSNIPLKNITNLAFEEVLFDDAKSFMTMSFDHQISYGEHFKIVCLNYNVGNQSETKTVIFEVIASNDKRLRNSRLMVSPYVLTNQIEDGKIEIYRMTFYTLSEDHSIQAPLSTQLKRLADAIRKFDSFIYVQDLRDDSISIMSMHRDTYFLHITADTVDMTLKYNEDGIPDEDTSVGNDYIHYYNKNMNIPLYLLNFNPLKFSSNLKPFSIISFEILGWRKSSIMKFHELTQTDKFTYLIYDDIYKEIKDIKSVLVNTNKGFFPLEKYTLYDEHVVTYKNNDGKLLYNLYETYIVMNPYDLSHNMINSVYEVRQNWNKINLFDPVHASLALMGILSIRDLNTSIDTLQTIQRETSLKTKLLKNEVVDPDSFNSKIKRYTVYKILSGKILDIPTSQNIMFMVLDDKIMYNSNTNDYGRYETGSVPFIGPIHIDTDTEICLADISSYDFYMYTVKTPLMKHINFFEDHNDIINSEVNIPFVPAVNCLWKSTGVYFDHDLNMNTDYFDSYTLTGNFIENKYTPSDATLNLYIVNSLSDMTSSGLSIDLFIKKSSYSYPIRKFLVSNTNIQTAIGTYNKYILTLEFIYYGIKFIFRFSDASYTSDIKLNEYNNYEIFMLIDYDESKNNEMIISTREQMILVINHLFNINEYAMSTEEVKNDDSTWTSPAYKKFKAPYTIDMANAFYIDGNMTFVKSNNSLIDKDNAKYFVQLDTYDSSSIYTYFLLEKFDDSNDYITIFDTSVMNTSTVTDTTVTYDSHLNPLNFLSNIAYLREAYVLYDSLADSSALSGYSSIDMSDKDSLREYNKSLYSKYILGKVETASDSEINQDKISRFMKSFESDLDCYIVKEESTSKVTITSKFLPIKLSMQIPNKIKYIQGYFSPDFVDVVKFDTNDEIRETIGMDCLLANTKIVSVNTLKNYTCNKIMQNTSHQCQINYYMIPEKSICGTNWDNNVYRIYTNDTSYTSPTSYSAGINDKMLFGSKCIVLKKDGITFDYWNFDLADKVMTSLKRISSFNKNTNARQVFEITVNLTKQFYLFFSSNESFTRNWLDNFQTTDMNTAINNYINNTLIYFYNIEMPKIEMYRKYDIAKTGLNLLLELPEDIDLYQSYSNFASTYKKVNNEIILYIDITDYDNYIYYFKVKIDRQ